MIQYSLDSSISVTKVTIKSDIKMFLLVCYSYYINSMFFCIFINFCVFFHLLAVISVKNYVRKECTQLLLPFVLCYMSAFTAVNSKV